jgi:small subunit ribosomal protein S6
MVTGKVEIKENVNDYELTVIFKPDLSEEKLTAAVENVKKLITAKGGVLAEAKSWGRRRLAYPIKHAIEGNYILFKFANLPSHNHELESNLRITEDIMRHLLVKID